jgi:hypothetical protein
MLPVQKRPCLAAAELSEEEKHGTLPLLELPDSILTSIATALLDDANGHPLLAVSRSTRDAVLRASSQVTLDVTEKPESTDYRPLGRLLQRACTEAAPGLTVVLNLEDGHGLPTLLQPALDSSNGFRHVHRLEVGAVWRAMPLPQVWTVQSGIQHHCRLASILGALFSQVTTHRSSYLSFLGAAMPCLKHLFIDLETGADIGDGGLFAGLQPCSGLETLCLVEFAVSPAAVRPSAAALARLKNLRRVQLRVYDSCGTGPAGLVEQLTCLTHLYLSASAGNHVAGMLAAAARNPGLQDLYVSSDLEIEPTAAQTQHLLTSCPSLTDLDLDYLSISQDVLEVILTYGTNIKKLRAYTVRADVSFADRPCSWRSLGVAGIEHRASVLHWAHLPLKGLTELEIWDSVTTSVHDGGRGTLQIPFNSIDLDQVPQKLREATTNLAACPAWQAKPDSCIALGGDPNGPFEDIHIFSAQQRIQLLEALAPVGGPHVKKVLACMHGAVFEWGRPELQALGCSINSSQLSALTLDNCILTVGFWAALDQVLPALRTLTLRSHVTCSASDIAVFCSKRKQGHQLTVTLGKQLYEAHDGAGIQASLVGQGIFHVKIKL